METDVLGRKQKLEHISLCAAMAQGKVLLLPLLLGFHEV
jgi:hypothetical protein